MPGIKSLISQFDNQKSSNEGAPVTSPPPAPPKPPRASSNITEREKIPHLVRMANEKSDSRPPMARKSSAPAQLEKIPQLLSALQQQEQLEPLSETGEETVLTSANNGIKRTPWGVAAHGNKVHLPGLHHHKQCTVPSSQDSGVCPDAEGAGSHVTPPTHTEGVAGQNAGDSVPFTRFVSHACITQQYIPHVKHLLFATLVYCIKALTNQNDSRARQHISTNHFIAIWNSQKEYKNEQEL